MKQNFQNLVIPFIGIIVVRRTIVAVVCISMISTGRPRVTISEEVVNESSVCSTKWRGNCFELSVDMFCVVFANIFSLSFKDTSLDIGPPLVLSAP